jgi:hypothetical protein
LVLGWNQGTVHSNGEEGIDCNEEVNFIFSNKNGADTEDCCYEMAEKEGTWWQ